MRTIKAIVALAASLAVADCTVDNGAAPPLSGPSDFGLSVALSASPDQLPRDGSSRSTISDASFG